MIFSLFRTGMGGAVAAWWVLAAGCAAVPTREGDERTRAWVSDAVSPAGAAGAPMAVLASAPDQSAAAGRVHEVLSAPLNARGALELSLIGNPRVAAEFARLGIAQSDVVAAGRLANPVLAGSRTVGGGSQIAILSISQSLSGLFLLPARKRFASGEYARAQRSAAAAIIDLAVDVEQAWYRYVGAEQIAAMRALIEKNAQAAGDLAQRFFAAGNIDELELALERSAAAQATIAAIRAAADATAAKYSLHQLMGLTGEPQWTALLQLPVPEASAPPLEALLTAAHARRGDLIAARQEIALLDDALTLAQHWRWLGTVDVGFERDREQDAAHLIGPTFSLALPIFDQGQAGIARAQGRLAEERARLAALEIEIDNRVRLDHARLDAARALCNQYATLLNPAEDMIVQRQQQRQNFMLIGQFELLLAKQQQYDAYQSYLEAVRDYWLVHAELERAAGGALPGDAAESPATVGVEAPFQSTPVGAVP